MARPTESPSGLPRINKTIRIDPILAGYAQDQDKKFNFSAEVEKSITNKLGLSDGPTRELANYILTKNTVGCDSFATEEQLKAKAADYLGYDLETICMDCDTIEDLMRWLSDPNSDGYGFNADVINEEWPDEHDRWNCGYRVYYCHATDEFGTYFISKAAWEENHG